MLVANRCTMGTFAYTGTTERELRSLQASEPYLKWSHSKKGAIISGHQVALRHNTQLLFLCFVVSVAMLLGGPVGEVGIPTGWPSLWDPQFATLNTLHATMRPHIAVKPSESLVDKVCGRRRDSAQRSSSSGASRPIRTHLYEACCDVLWRVVPAIDGVNVLASPQYVFAGVFVYVMGLTLLLLPILQRFRSLQDCAVELGASVSTSTASGPSFYEAAPTLLSPSVPLLLPTSKSAAGGRFTNERELVDEYEHCLLKACGKVGPLREGGLRSAAIGLVVVGLVMIEAHLCVLRGESPALMKSVMEWVVLAATTKALVLVQNM